MIAVLAQPREGLRDRVAEMLGRDDGVFAAESPAELERIVSERAGEPATVIVGATIPNTQRIEVAERLQAVAPEVGVIFVVTSLTSKLLQAAMRAGVRDVLAANFGPEQLTDSLARTEEIGRRITGPQEETREHRNPHTGRRVITVCGLKGGSGKSVVASNLAIQLADATAEPVALVDLSLEFGDLAAMLRLRPVRTIADAARDIESLDAASLEGYLTPIGPSVKLLAGTPDPTYASGIAPQATQRIISMLAERFSYVVIDTPPVFDEHVLSALDQSDEVVLVASLDVPSVKELKISLQTLERLGIPRKRIRVVLNRANSNVGLNQRMVEKSIATTVDVAIPSTREVPISVNTGRPIVLEEPKSRAARSVAKLADDIRHAPRASNVA